MKRNTPSTQTSNTLLNILAPYQIAGGIIGIGFGAKFIPQLQNPAASTWVGLVVAGILYVFSIVCGLLLFKKPRTGINLSFLNQMLQVLSFSAVGIAYNYVAGLKLGIGVDFVETLAFKLRLSLSSFQLSFNGNSGVPYITVNLLALVMIYLLEKLREDMTSFKS